MDDNSSSNSSISSSSISTTGRCKSLSRKHSTYADVQYLQLKDDKTKIAYFVIKHETSNQYLLWVNNFGKTTSEMYVTLLSITSALQIGAILFDYQGTGNSQGTYSVNNCYQTLKNIMKEIRTITDNWQIKINDVILCGDGMGATLINRYIKHHRHGKIIFLDPPEFLLKSSRKKVKILSTKPNSKVVKNCVTLNSRNDLINGLSEFI